MPVSSLLRRSRLLTRCPHRCAAVDIYGLRSNEVPEVVRKQVVDDYPRLGFKREFAGLFGSEAKQVPRSQACTCVGTA